MMTTMRMSTAAIACFALVTLCSAAPPMVCKGPGRESMSTMNTMSTNPERVAKGVMVTARMGMGMSTMNTMGMGTMNTMGTTNTMGTMGMGTMNTMGMGTMNTMGPSCGCRDSSGKTYAEGETWTCDCKSCYCSSGKIYCDPVTCPTLTCPACFQKTPAGACCPVCTGCKDCTGNWHSYGDKWTDKCKIYECTPCGEITTKPVTCPTLTCPECFQKTPEGACCPVCKACKDRSGNWHSYGDKWTDKCKIYECKANGDITSTAVTCPTLTCPECFRETPEGACCPICKACLDAKNNWRRIGEIWNVGCIKYQCAAPGKIITL